MADRIGYPTSDISAFGAAASTGVVLWSCVDDDGNAADFVDLFDAAGSFMQLGFDTFGAMPTADAQIELVVWLLWSGASAVNTTIQLLEGGTSRGSDVVVPTGSNTPYSLIVPASSFTAVTGLRGAVSRSAGGTGAAQVTGMKIIMPGAAFAHLDLINGLPAEVAAGTLGDLSLSGGLPIRSSHGERYGSSLILTSGLPAVQVA